MNTNDGYDSERQPQHFTFNFDPHEVTDRFDPIFNQHLAYFESCPPPQPSNITLSMAKNHLAGIHQHIQQLRQQCTNLTETGTSTTMTDQQRQTVYDQLTEQHRHIDAMLAAASSADRLRTIRDLVRKRRNKRKRVKELRLHKRQQQNQRALETDAMQSSAEPSTTCASDEVPLPTDTVSKTVGNNENIREQNRAKQANKYLLLCERLAELHNVRCQQATRRPDATFLSEIATLRRLWSEATLKPQ